MYCVYFVLFATRERDEFKYKLMGWVKAIERKRKCKKKARESGIEPRNTCYDDMRIKKELGII